MSKSQPRHKFHFKNKLFSPNVSLLDASLKVFRRAEYKHMKGRFKLHIALDSEGLIPAFTTVTLG